MIIIIIIVIIIIIIIITIITITPYTGFLKNKKRPGTSLPVSFSARFLKKNTYLGIFY